MSPFLEKHDILHVRRMRKHVYRLYCHDLIVRIKKLEVAGLGGRVAADIDYALGSRTDDDIDDIGMHSGTRRVGDDDIRLAVLCDKV